MTRITYKMTNFPSLSHSLHPHHLLRKVFPKGSRLRKGFLGSIVRAFPGIMLSTSPCMRAVKQSVVGSGPILLPGKSSSMRYLNTRKHICVINSTQYMYKSEIAWNLPDESCLSSWVLTNHQHHWFAVKVCILVTRRMKVMERVVFFNRQYPLVIKIPQLFCHHIDVPEHFRVAPKPPDGHGDKFFLLISLVSVQAAHTSKTRLNDGRMWERNIVRFSQLSAPSCSGTFQGWRGCNQSLQLHPKRSLCREGQGGVKFLRLSWDNLG